MPLLDEIRFEGHLSGHGQSVPIGFSASIDDDGKLLLQLDTMPVTRAALDLYVSPKTGEKVDYLDLHGEAENGYRFSSDSFHVTSYNHGDELSYQGQCDDAYITMPRDDDPGPVARRWLVRQFRTFRGIAHDTPLGRVTIAGPSEDREAQAPSGSISIERNMDGADEQWWQESEALLIHLVSLLSFACDTYLRPVIEQRFDADVTTIRIASQGRAAAPYMAPFHFLDMHPIFRHACDSFFTHRDTVEKLDPAIRWLTAPAYYDESRFLNAMTGIENVIDRSGIENLKTFLKGGELKRMERAVRQALRDIEAPDAMLTKVAELNRRSIKEKILAYIEAHDIVVADMPESWLRTLVNARNAIVHSGLSVDHGEDDPDTMDHIIWSRELLTRMILAATGFTGQYRSFLHGDEFLYFPEGIPMSEYVARNPPPAA